MNAARLLRHSTAGYGAMQQNVAMQNELMYRYITLQP